MSVSDSAGRGCPDEAQVERVLLEPGGSDEDRAVFLAHLERCGQCRLLAGVLVEGAGERGHARPNPNERPPPVRAFIDAEVLDDRYEILGFVARGGMGEVYRAHDQLLGETVALKTVLCDSSAEQDALVRFRAEVQLARRVTHRNVCRILDFGLHQRPPHPPTPFFTMPFLEGETLARHLARRGRLPASEVGPLVEQIAAGLDAIHREGIVHRDLKSENVFLLANPGGEPRVILMDFGLARLLMPSLSQILSTGTGLVGTPAYVAPELMLGKVVTPRADIYSLGVIVFEMLTGRLPFDGATAVQAAARRLYTAPPRLREVAPAVDGRWETLVARCLEREEERRFHNVGALLAALSGLSTPTRPARRRRAATIGAALAIACVGIALVGMLRNTKRQARLESPAGTATVWTRVEAPRAPSPAMTPSAARSVSPTAFTVDAAAALSPERKGRAPLRERTRAPKGARRPAPEIRALPEHPLDSDALVDPYD